MPHSPAAVIAATAAVLYRRSGNDTITLHVTAGDTTLGTFRFEMRPGLTWPALEAAAGTPDSPGGAPAAGDVRLRLAADGSVVPGEEIDAGTAAQIRAVVHGAPADPGRPVHSFPLMPADDDGAAAAQVRSFGAGPPAGAPATVPDLVAARAAAAPDATAVRFAGEEVSYAALMANAERIARGLRRLGLGRGEPVGVLMERSAAMVPVLLGVLRAGGAYVALPADDPPARTSAQLAAAGVRFVVAGHADVLPPGSGARVLVAHDLPDDGTGSGADDPGGTPDDLAYVSFTSGSTGEPRPVAVPHRAVSRLVHDPDWLKVTPDDRFCLLAPLAFDASTLELWMPLAAGATLVVAPPGHLDLAELADLITRERISVLWLTAGLFHALVAGHPEAFARVRHVIAGGDVVSPERVHRLLTRHPGLVFTNGYGPTENTTFTSCWTTDVPPAPDRPLPIGRPIAGTGVLVLDPAMREVPAGVRGEIHAYGEGLARGYLGDPAATAERFVTLPEPPHTRLYRTGDLGRWREDGLLEFLGRADQQVKVQGFRVEPGAVEAALTALPAIGQAVVVPQEDGEGGRRLLAYVTVREEVADPGAFAAEVRAALAERLPRHQVPWAVLIRPDLPLTGNGKVDRAALPARHRAPRAVWNDFVAPRGAMEQRLADLWGEVLGVEPVGVTDDFFDLGGHSILAAGLIERVHREFDVDLPARKLYTQPTVAELAENLAGLLPAQ